MCCCIKSRSKKFKACGIASVATGVVLLGLGIGWPFIMAPLVIKGAKDATALTRDQQDMWRSVPGKFDINIERHTYVYHCTNRDDVRAK